MADNLDDFLRRAAERRQQRNQQQPPKPQPPVQQNVPPTPPRTVVSGRTAPPPQQKQKTERPNNQQTVKQKQTQQPKKSQSNWESRQRLSSTVETRDNAMNAHIHQVFDHQLGQFETRAAGAHAPVTHSPKPDINEGSNVEQQSLAQQVAAMFRDVNNSKVAFVASEIFQRRF